MLLTDTVASRDELAHQVTSLANGLTRYVARFKGVVPL